MSCHDQDVASSCLHGSLYQIKPTLHTPSYHAAYHGLHLPYITCTNWLCRYADVTYVLHATKGRTGSHTSLHSPFGYVVGIKEGSYSLTQQHEVLNINLGSVAGPLIPLSATELLAVSRMSQP